MPPKKNIEEDLDDSDNSPPAGGTRLGTLSAQLNALADSMRTLQETQERMALAIDVLPEMQDKVTALCGVAPGHEFTRSGRNPLEDSGDIW
jgi:hypothetical protein